MKAEDAFGFCVVSIGPGDGGCGFVEGEGGDCQSINRLSRCCVGVKCSNGKRRIHN